MAVALDVSSAGQATASAVATGGTLSWTHGGGAGLTNSCAVVVVAYDPVTNDDALATLGVTFGGSSMTSIGTAHSNANIFGYVQLFALAGVGSGNQTVVVTLTASGGRTGNLTGGSVTYTGVDQATPTQNFTSHTDASVAHVSLAVTTASGNMVVGGVVDGTSVTGCHTGEGTTDWTKANPAAANAGGHAGQGHIASTGASMTIGFDISGADWSAIVACDLKASTGGGPAFIAPPPFIVPQAIVTSRYW